MESYLTGREQVTVIDHFNTFTRTFEEDQSNPTLKTVGLPQGSILGPLLFLVYVNDLPNIINHRCIMFADDATIFIQNKPNTNFESNINETLKIVIDWLGNIILNVNLTKTKIMQFRNYKTKPLNFNIVEKNTKIDEVENTNYLRVEIDCHLNWKAHIMKTNKKYLVTVTLYLY